MKSTASKKTKKTTSKSKTRSKAGRAPRSKNLKEDKHGLQIRHQQLMVVAVISIIANLLLVGVAGYLAKERQDRGMVHLEGLPETMDPEIYDGQTRESYQVAADIPAVLDALFCYCYCKENFDHRSLLACYVDEHASTCKVCQDEALRAQELWDEGNAIQDIADQIDEEFN